MWTGQRVVHEIRVTLVDWLRRVFAGSPATQTEEERQRRDFRVDPLPAGEQRFEEGPAVSAVGESQYRASIEVAVGRWPGGHADIVDAALVWEPDNPYDPNAIAVQIRGRTCGYLARPDALRYRPVMEWARANGVTPVVRGEIRGGWQMEDGTWADFGITVYIANPKNLLQARP